MPTVLFNSSSGRNYSKKRKRMPGTDMTLKPEMKVYDGFNIASGADVFSDRTWTNLCASTGNLPDGVSFSWNPYTISPPNQGAGINQRIGKNYVLRFLKFKGYITLYKRCPMPVSWRLVLYKYTDTNLSNLGRSSYLEMFSKKRSAIPEDAYDWKEWTAYNFYCKVLRSDLKPDFRRKVIASGTLPAGSQSFVYDSQPLKGVVTSEEYGGAEALYVPVDVSVQVNDLIDPDVTRYGIVVENDNGVGYDVDTNYADDPDTDLDYGNRVFDLQIFCKAYFQDP